MVLKLRLARPPTPTGSRRHAPFYNLVLTHSRTARDALPLEVLGTYDPIPRLPTGYSETDTEVKQGKVRKTKEIKVDVARARYWLGVGAQCSGTVWRVLAMIGLLPPKYLPTGARPNEKEALKAARFPTHLPRKASSTTTGTPVTDAIKANAARQAGEIGAGTTSPQNANEA